jgi:hypothetical protein
MNLKPLLKCLGHSIHEIQETLSAHNIAYGHYTVRELRKAIQDRQPAIIPFHASTVLVVGENPGSFILADARGRVREVPDSDFTSAWDGRAVLVQGDIPDTPRESDLVILTPERDTWSRAWGDARDKALHIISKLTLGASWLPDHPVILTFRTPSDHEIKNHIRSMTAGPEIVIYDPTDPISEFLHELGHIYWSNRLTDQERDTIRDHHATLSEDSISPLFTSRAYWETDEEYFATIFMWYAKGKLLHGGYMKLLKQMDTAGYRMINSIIDRVDISAARKRAWEEAEPFLRAFVDAQEDQRRYLVSGKARMIKARMSVKLPESAIPFPADLVAHEVMKRAGSVRIVKIGEGRLEGAVLPIEDGCINLPLAKAIYRYYKPLSKSIPSRKDISRLQRKIIIDCQGKKQIAYVQVARDPVNRDITPHGVDTSSMESNITRETEPIHMVGEVNGIRPEFIAHENENEPKDYKVQTPLKKQFPPAAYLKVIAREFLEFLEYVRY